MQQQEIKLQKKLLTKDSVAAKQEIVISHAKYEALLKKIQSPQNISVASSHKAYIPGLDSVGTMMKLFQSQGSKLNNLIPQDKLAQIQSLSSATTDLQNKINQSADIQQFVDERKQDLQQVFKQYGLENQLLPIKKQMFYYQQKIKEYNDLLHDENK